MFKLYILHLYVMDEFSVYVTGFEKRSLSNSESMINWMCVEDPFSQVRSHIAKIIFIS